MKQVLSAILSTVLLSGCAIVQDRLGRADPAPETAPAPAVPAAAPQDAVAPPANARTVESFDTTTDAERAAATAPSEQGGERSLGRTIASLGAVGEGGIWIKTPLVSKPSRGRVVYPQQGTSVAVDLIPLQGDAGSGSQLSLAAMRLLKADLTSLPEVEVFQSGD